MNETLATDLMNSVKSGLHAAVKDRLTSSYNNPLGKVLDDVIAKEADSLRELLLTGVKDAIADPQFREDIRAAIRVKLAKTLVERFGGELEKQVNALKSDPATRARLTIAIDEIVKRAAG